MRAGIAIVMAPMPSTLELGRRWAGDTQIYICPVRRPLVRLTAPNGDARYLGLEADSCAGRAGLRSGSASGVLVPAAVGGRLNGVTATFETPSR